MKYTHWINLGRDMALVDERGAVLGLIITLDDQIGRKIRKSFYGAPRAPERYVLYEDTKTKENERNAV